MTNGTYTFELSRPPNDARGVEQELRYFLGQELAKRIDLATPYVVEFRLGNASYESEHLVTYRAHVHVHRAKLKSDRPGWWGRLITWAHSTRAMRRSVRRERRQQQLDEAWFRSHHFATVRGARRMTVSEHARMSRAAQ
jgi:hypothetical protein